MNNVLKRLIFSEHKRFFKLLIILVVSLVLSGFIYLFIGQENMENINYESVSKLNVSSLFIKNFSRNIIYFIILALLTCMGQGKIINVAFSVISIIYGLSIIHLLKTVQIDKIYFLFTFADYFIFFPFLFYFTFISDSISKYTKRTKKIETNSHKFDIIITGYMKLASLYFFIVCGYSLAYSYYIKILGKMLVG